MQQQSVYNGVTNSYYFFDKAGFEPKSALTSRPGMHDIRPLGQMWPWPTGDGKFARLT